MIGVVCRSVDNRLEKLGHAEVAVVYGNRPDVDGHVEQQVSEFVHWKQENVNVVRKALEKTINGVEGVASIRCG